jgi:hypothetical protein
MNFVQMSRSLSFFFSPGVIARGQPAKAGWGES